jgi:hypothetical protein
MGLRNGKRADPIAQRARALDAEIEALQEQIRRLGTQVINTGDPAGRGGSGSRETRGTRPMDSALREPVFEAVDHNRVKSQGEPQATAEHYSELGVRKYDLAGAWKRFQGNFHGPPASNPKLINYLAAGSIQGLRPLRYEKRVARNRVLALAFLLAMVLWGLFAIFWRH